MKRNAHPFSRFAGEGGAQRRMRALQLGAAGKGDACAERPSSDLASRGRLLPRAGEGKARRLDLPRHHSRIAAQAPSLRGRLTANAPLAPYTWFRVGGPAQVLFQPADEEDLAYFLERLPREIPVTTIGLGSNLIVRDGGVAGVVIRLGGKAFGAIEAAADHRDRRRSGGARHQGRARGGRSGRRRP